MRYVIPAGILVLVGCQSSEPEALAVSEHLYPSAVVAPAFPPITREWVDVASWRGGGNKTTEQFQIHGDQWRVVYAGRIQQTGITGIVGFAAFSTDRRVMGTAYMERTGDDVTHFHRGPGAYYLDISASNMNYAITVQDFRAVDRSSEHASTSDDLRNRSSPASFSVTLRRCIRRCQWSQAQTSSAAAWPRTSGTS